MRVVGRERGSAKLAAVVVGALAACAVAEIAARVHARSTDAAWSRERASERLARARAALASEDTAGQSRAPRSTRASDVILHPYLGFESREATVAMPVLARETRDSAGARVFEVAVVGGSMSRRIVEPLAERLAAALAEEGREVRVRASGSASFKQPQQALSLHWAIANGMRLDALVNLDGLDGVVVAGRNAVHGQHPLYPDVDIWSRAIRGRASADEHREALARWVQARDSALRSCTRAARVPWLGSAVLGAPFVASAERRARSAVAARERLDDIVARTVGDPIAERGPTHPYTAEEVLAAVVRAWTEGSLSLAATCEERGIRYLHVLEPFPADGDRPEALGLAHARLRSEGERLRGLGVAFLDASHVFPAGGASPARDERTDDAMCELLTERIAAALLSR